MLRIETTLICDICGNEFSANKSFKGMELRKLASLFDNWIYSNHTDACENCRVKKLNGEFPKKHKLHKKRKLHEKLQRN